MRLKDAIDDFASWHALQCGKRTGQGYVLHLRYLCLYLRNPEIEGITAQEVSQFFLDMRDIGWATNSFTPKRSAIVKFLRYWRLQGKKVIHEELVPPIKKEFKLPRVATNEEFAQLMTVAMGDTPWLVRDRAILQLLRDTGCRVNELTSLDLTDIDTARRRSTIKTEKARRYRPIRQIFWTTEANQSLLDWLRVRERLIHSHTVTAPAALFLSFASLSPGSKASRVSANRIREMLWHYCDIAHIQRLNPHSLRHRLGHELIKKRASNSDVANILGHSSVDSTMIYTHMVGEELEGQYRAYIG